MWHCGLVVFFWHHGGPPKKKRQRNRNPTEMPRFHISRRTRPWASWSLAMFGDPRSSTPVSGVKLWTWEGGLGELRLCWKWWKVTGKIGGNENLGGGLMIFRHFTPKHLGYHGPVWRACFSDGLVWPLTRKRPEYIVIFRTGGTFCRNKSKQNNPLAKSRDCWIFDIDFSARWDLEPLLGWIHGKLFGILFGNLFESSWLSRI